MDYGPRTKKQSTGLFFPPAGGRAVLISASLLQIKILRRGTAKDFYLEGVDTLDAVPNADALPGQAEKSPNVNCVQAQSDVKRR